MSRQKAAALSLSAAALVAIAVSEGYRGEAYYATKHEQEQGISTIGFGETQGVKPTDRTTPERALVHLLGSSDKYANAVRGCANVPMTQGEFDAFVSLAYNIGPGNFCGSTLVKKLHAGDYAGACEEIKRWNRQAGVVLPGLTKRREKEYQTCVS